MLNDLFRTYKKIIILAVVLISGILFWFFGCHRMGQQREVANRWEQREQGVQIYDFGTSHISGDISFGSGGHLSADRVQPVLMHVKTLGDSFSGTVKITLPGEDGKGVACQSAVRCSKEEEARIALSVPDLGNVSFFSVEILDQYGTEELARMIVGAGGTVWAEDTDDMTLRKKVLVGILSDRPDRLSWLGDLEIPREDCILVFDTVELGLQDLMNGAGSLESLSLIIIDDYDTSFLSPIHLNSLKSWVREKGGGLVLAAGARADAVLSGIGSFAEINAGKGKKQALQFYEDDESAGYLSVATNAVSFADRTVWKTGRISFPVSSYYRNVGQGKIALLTFSLTDDAFRQWTGKERMAREFFDNLLAQILYPVSKDENAVWLLKKTMYAFLNPQTPNTLYYAIFFMVYLSVLVFFSYYILRKARKKEYIWIIVPAVSFFFTVCVAIRLGGFGSNALNSYSAVEIMDPEHAFNDIFFLYQNNDGESGRVDLVEDVSCTEPIDYSYNIGEEDVTSLHRLKQDYTINNTRNGYDIAFEAAVPGTSRLLYIKKKAAAAGHADCFKADLYADYTSFHGTVSNRSAWDFSRLILIRGNQYIVLSDVGKGQSRTFDAADTSCWSGTDLETVSYPAEEGGSAVDGLADYIRYRYINGEEDFNTVLIAGITQDREIRLLSGQEELENHQTVLVSRVQLPADRSLMYIPDINRSCLTNKEALTGLSTGFLESEKTRADYQLDRDKSVWCAARGNDTFTGTIYAYNYKTGKDDPVFKEQNTVLNGEEIEPYLSEMNKMTLTYRLGKGEDYGAAPVLTFVLKDE